MAITFAHIPLATATPANKKAFTNHFDGFLTANMETCATCHVAERPDGPLDLEHFPHNAFGKRIRAIGAETSIPERIQAIADEDSDKDGIPNLTEILLGHFPGDAKDSPDKEQLARQKTARDAYSRLVTNAYKWQPLAPVSSPNVPKGEPGWAANPVDHFVAEQHQLRGLHPRPPADPETLLRRLHLDLTGLAPTPEEIAKFVENPSPEAYSSTVDKLLGSPAYGERWGRHWMDIWRYADWGGYKEAVRFSQPHIWRWRDWIVNSLNADKPYDQMLREMLAADELYPESTDKLPATGFLVRNYNRNRVQWLDDVLEHSGKAFLGLTMNCAKCHDHKYDPISMDEYYQLRAIFEPYDVRTDPIPGQLDAKKDGLPRAYDKTPGAQTFVFQDGDDRHPLKDRPIAPGVPVSLGGQFEPTESELPLVARDPLRQDFVREMMLEKARNDATGAKSDAAKEATTARVAYLEALFDLEEKEDRGEWAKDKPEWKKATSDVADLARISALAAAKWKTEKAAATLKAAGEDKKKIDAAKKSVAAAKKELATADKKMEGEAKFEPRKTTAYPAKSTGRRTAFANWLTDPQNPLTARVAANHIWLRHFGTGLVPTPDDFGGNGRRPSHPALLDWLAAELVGSGWSIKHLHRLIVTSSTYRLSGTGNPDNATKDPENRYLWRAPLRRMEGEIVRDNLLHIAGLLDTKRGGPDIAHTDAEKSHRRSIYLRHGPEKTVEFIQIFDGPAVSECYQRERSVAPHQALALANSKLTSDAATALEKSLPKSSGFIQAAFVKIIGRKPSPDESKLCENFLANGDTNNATKMRTRLLSILFNHNDFITIR